MLDDLQIMPIDSESLTKVMHEHGINMRYLSHICVLTQMPHVMDLCVTEMLARTCKHIINKQMSELILENKLEFNYLEGEFLSTERRITELKTQKKAVGARNRPGRGDDSDADEDKKAQNIKHKEEKDRIE